MRDRGATPAHPDRGTTRSIDTAAFLFISAIKSELYELAMDILQQSPRLVSYELEQANILLFTLAELPKAFSRRSQLGFLKKWIYDCIELQPTDGQPTTGDVEHLPGGSRSMHSSFSNDLFVFHWFRGLLSNALKVMQKEVYNLKKLDYQACKVLKRMLPLLENHPHASETVFVEALIRGTVCGNAEFVQELLRFDHSLLWGGTEYGSIFHIAVGFRQERIWNLIYNIGPRNLIDVIMQSNNILHMVASPRVFSECINVPEIGSVALERQRELNWLVVRRNPPGAVLKLQRELQWYKEVESIAPHSHKLFVNDAGLTPWSLFIDEHKELVEAGEKWVKETAQLCTIVAVLIATVMFAAPFTLPGGIDDDSGKPILLHNPLFQSFMILDAASFFFSLTAVFMFLSILTSRYAMADFLKSLPKRLIISLFSLFCSIITMMATFFINYAIVMGAKVTWVAPVCLLAAMPVVSFMLLQFPLLVEMASSTYGPSIFHRGPKFTLKRRD